jgi:hypothetical protein
MSEEEKDTRTKALDAIQAAQQFLSGYQVILYDLEIAELERELNATKNTVATTTGFAVDPELEGIVVAKIDLSHNQIHGLHGRPMHSIGKDTVKWVMSDLGMQIATLTGRGNPSGWPWKPK